MGDGVRSWEVEEGRKMAAMMSLSLSLSWNSNWVNASPPAPPLGLSVAVATEAARHSEMEEGGRGSSNRLPLHLHSAGPQ